MRGRRLGLLFLLLLLSEKAAGMKINLFNQHTSQQKGVDFLQEQLLHHIQLIGQHTVGRAYIKLVATDFFNRTEFPVLLLDDVMSELDNSRRSQLLLFIDGRVQTFITVNDRELIPELAGNAYFKISGGCISEA